MAGWREGGRAGLFPAALLAFCTLWRLPTLADPPWLNDEGTYATVGQALVQGEALYRQIWENKPPGIYLLYGLVHLLTGPAHLLVGVRILSLLASLLILCAVFRIASRLAGAWAGALALLLCGLLIDLPLLDGTSANAEILLAAATSAGMALILPMFAGDRAASTPAPRIATARALGRDRRGRSAHSMHGLSLPDPPLDAEFDPPATPFQRAAAPAGPPPPMAAAGPPSEGDTYELSIPCVVFLAGFAFGIALLFKLVAGADVLAALLVSGAPGASRPLRGRLGRAGCLLAGVAVPVAAVAVWLGARGLVGDALYATVDYNRGYVATGQTLHALPLTLLTLAAPTALLVLAAGLAVSGCGTSASLTPSTRGGLPPSAAVTLWLALALLGALASGRSYPHYYLQAAPPLALALALLISHLCRYVATRQHRVLVALVVCWSLGVPLGSWLALRHEPAHAAPGSDQAGYYAHAWRYLTGGLDSTAFGNSLDPRVERNLAIIRYLTDHPATPRRLYIWGNTPWIYYLSGYEHAARFISAYYRPAIPGGMGQVITALTASPPPYALVIAPPSPDSAVLRGLLRARYISTYRVQNATLYRLRPAR